MARKKKEPTDEERGFSITPEELKIKFDTYFDKVSEDQGEFPDIDGFKLRFDISEDEYRAMCEDSTYKKVIEYTVRKRRSWLQRMIANGTNKNVNGLIKLLMQPENGGIIDKPVQEDVDQKVIVHFET